MKYAFFIIVLVNLVFYLWEGQRGNSQPEQDPAYSESSPRQIQLLSEITSSSASSDAIPEHQIDSVTPEEPGISDPQDVQTGEIQASVIKDTELQNEAAIATLAPDNQQPPSVQSTEPMGDTSRNVSGVNATRVPQESLVSATIPEGVQQNRYKGPANSKSTEFAAGLSATEPRDAPSAANSLTKRDKPPESTGPDQEEIPQCLEVGPFDNPTHLSEWLQQEHFDRSQIETFSRNARVLSDYIVFFPAAETMEESEENVTVLKNMGVNDVWLFRQGELKGAISLGIFVHKSRAELVRDQMFQRGVAAQITERYEELPRLFVKLYQNSSFQPDSPLTATKCQP